MNRTMWITLLVAALVGGCQSAPSPKEYRLNEVPPSLAPTVADAESTIARLQRRLGARLKSEIESKGLVSAVAVCRDSAQLMTAETVERQGAGVAAGRTSHRLRNPGNAPRPWAQSYVAAVAPGAKAADFAPVVVDLGDRVGLLRPIETAALCVRCHGMADSLAADLAALLRESYPQDQALGFAEGDLRGYVWAEVPRRK
jgi:hypothetical protein